MVGAGRRTYAVQVGPFLRYTALRLLVLLAVGALLWAVGLRYLLWAVLTVLVAAAVSYVLLSGPRDALLARLGRSRPAPVDEDAPRRPARATRADRDAAAEDAALDAAEQPDDRPTDRGGLAAGPPPRADPAGDGSEGQADAQGDRERQL